MLSIKYFIYFIIFIKLIFLISAIGHIILSHTTSTKAETLDPKLLYWKERTEFIFTISMAILLIYYFNPRFTNFEKIDKETSLLFFLFGWILIITAQWSLFIKESKWYKQIVSSLR